MERLVLVFGFIFLTFLAITYLLHRFFSSKKYVKYIPALISLLLAVFYAVTARSMKGEGFRDLANILMATLLFGGFLSGLICSLYFDYIAPKLKNRKL